MACVFEFNVGSTMYHSRRKWMKNMADVTDEHRIWQPQRAGDSSNGRHGVMLMGRITGAKGQKYVMVFDGNHRYPVLWNEAELGNLASAQLKAATIWKKTK
jgi:hypothetical protein